MNTGVHIDITIGLDVGKTAHHACAMLGSGEIIYDKPLPQDETQLRQVFTDLKQHGTVLLVVDQPNTIGARARPPGSGHGGFNQEADLRIAGQRSSNTTGARYLHQECRRTVL